MDGSATVWINRRQGHRLSDREEHGDRPGFMVQGRVDVKVGG